jgi:hypothetical protein
MADSLCNGDYKQLTEVINNAFMAVTDDMQALCVPTESAPPEHLPQEYVVSVYETMKRLASINTSKAMGPDKIPNWLLKSCAITLAPAICCIWNTSLQQGKVPVSWKTGNICPIAKIPIPTDPNKHLRPITLAPQLSKCLEWFPRKWILETIADLIDPQQYGSLPKHSTVMALAELVHKWISVLETPKTSVRILFLDFRKAFDRVDHTTVIEKLESMGVPSVLSKWMKSFLSGRKQCVKINNSVSKETYVKAGIPQGTLLGPVTFLIHINDLQPGLDTVKFVDDTTLWEACDIQDAGHLQQAADKVLEWTDANKMQLNVDKTKEMVISFSKSPVACPQITMSDSSIERVDSFKLLGITLNSKLTWHNHIENIHKRASQRIYFLTLLKRAGVSPADIIHVYCSMIRSLLEYACVIWHPGTTNQQSATLESIQKRALKIALPDLCYEQALLQAGLLSLELRRENQCRQFFEQIKSSGHKLNYLLPPKRPEKNLRHQRQYEPPRLRTKRLKQSPINYGLFKFQ